MQLLTRHNTKLAKASKKGYLSQGVHLAPYKSKEGNVCPFASKGCRQSCLNTSGFGCYNNVQVSRRKKTKLFFQDRDKFMFLLHQQIKNKIRFVMSKGMIPTFRINLTSDIAWEKIKFQGKNLMDHFPNVQFYDYCKDDKRMMKFLAGNFPKNYHLTFSRSETNKKKCDAVMAKGGNVAVVFEKRIPKTYLRKRVVTGMEHDLRFLDPKNVVIGLLAIGRAKKDDTGFVVKQR